ncbi:hypothetical protein B0G81_0026 [Paraburkholderia sp. BL6665CI2N2]|nr:hypothetical protein B0G81_0026 [Paraburkholderia sp. BL6665CI2N2]
MSAKTSMLAPTPSWTKYSMKRERAERLTKERCGGRMRRAEQTNPAITPGWQADLFNERSGLTSRPDERPRDGL